IQTVRPNFGDAAAGTLKADEWHMLITIFIPIALISIIATQYCQLLDHTMLLVSTTILVCMRTMMKHWISMVQSYLTEYISQIKDLYPDVGYHPNHHLLQHIIEFLQLFGPAHSWWYFPFEQLIRHLQRMLLNHHTGGKHSSHVFYIKY
ncbi:hypothetical protein C8Q75DRAFT_713575, partial [Abortiporus biennis]